MEGWGTILPGCVFQRGKTENKSPLPPLMEERVNSVPESVVSLTQITNQRGNIECHDDIRRTTEIRGGSLAA